MEIEEVLEDKELMLNITTVAKESTLSGRWLHEIPDHLLAEIYLDMREGATFIEIIDKVQKDWRILFDRNSRSLMGDLANFKMKALNDTALVEAQLKNGEPGAREIKDKLENLSARIDAMGRLGWLADVQTARVEKFIAMEDVEGKPLIILNDTIRQLSSILEKYIKLENDVGTSRITFSTTGQPLKAFAFEAQDDTDKIISATRRLLALTEERGLINTKDEVIDVPVIEASSQKVVVNA